MRHRIWYSKIASFFLVFLLTGFFSHCEHLMWLRRGIYEGNFRFYSSSCQLIANFLNAYTVTLTIKNQTQTKLNDKHLHKKPRSQKSWSSNVWNKFNFVKKNRLPDWSHPKVCVKIVSWLPKFDFTREVKGTWVRCPLVILNFTRFREA